jgi:hypothetical protein
VVEHTHSAGAGQHSQIVEMVLMSANVLWIFFICFFVGTFEGNRMGKLCDSAIVPIKIVVNDGPNHYWRGTLRIFTVFSGVLIVLK